MTRAELKTHLNAGACIKFEWPNYSGTHQFYMDGQQLMYENPDGFGRRGTVGIDALWAEIQHTQGTVRVDYTRVFNQSLQKVLDE